MLEIQKIDHVGIRISDKASSLSFYKTLGFMVRKDAGFSEGHPIIMEHSSGVVLNLLGLATRGLGTNILMDEEEKYSGVTHFALRVESVEEARVFLESQDIPITGEFTYGAMSAIFIRDPDRNVIELDSYGVEDVNSGPEKGYGAHE